MRIGRVGTSTSDGVGSAFAVCERLAQTTVCPSASAPNPRTPPDRARSNASVEEGRREPRGLAASAATARVAQAFVFVATHFADLALLEAYSNVHNFHLAAPGDGDPSARAADTAYKLSRGAFAGATYGRGVVPWPVTRARRDTVCNALAPHTTTARPVAVLPQYRGPGIRLAAAAGFPSTVLTEAKAISDEVRT